ncbi:MAG: hypothetical protein M5R36_06515 [Deltaproteobacteria bacterium]|nr:hypothetical protein [Deltaproteobacteria bacterium]
MFGWPVVHVAIGRKNGRRRVAKGIVAVGQFAFGFFTVAQFGVGIIFGFGQFLVGLTAVAQFAGGVLFGVGQIATGYIAIGQFAVGYYALAQVAFAPRAWTPHERDPGAEELFRGFVSVLKNRIST